MIIPDFCPVLGIPLYKEAGRLSKNWPDSPSVDQIIPRLGYTKDNIRIISNRANLLKSNAEIWELEAVLNDLKRLRF